jgi:hypothetical protein
MFVGHCRRWFWCLCHCLIPCVAAAGLCCFRAAGCALAAVLAAPIVPFIHERDALPCLPTIKATTTVASAPMKATMSAANADAGGSSHRRMSVVIVKTHSLRIGILEIQSPLETSQLECERRYIGLC